MGNKSGQETWALVRVKLGAEVRDGTYRAKVLNESLEGGHFGQKHCRRIVIPLDECVSTNVSRQEVVNRMLRTDGNPTEDSSRGLNEIAVQRKRGITATDQQVVANQEPAQKAAKVDPGSTDFRHETHGSKLDVEMTLVHPHLR